MKTKYNKDFRDKIHELLPNSVKTEANCNLLSFVMTTACIDTETQSVRVSMETVAKCYNLPADGNLKAGQKIRLFLGNLLKDFDVLEEGSAELVLTKDGKEWCKSEYEMVESLVGFDEDGNPIDKYKKTGDGKTRRVRVVWPKVIKDLIEVELSDVSRDKNKVFLYSGLTLSQKKEKANLRQLTEEAQNQIDILQSPISREIGSYMNSLPVSYFDDVLDNAGDAMGIIETLPTDIKDQQKRILSIVLEQPKPLYRPSKNGNTDRLFGYGANITNLKKEVRLALTKDWVEFDLSNSQLAIVSKIWEIPSLHTFLQTSSIWDEMYRYFNVKESDKKFFKKAIKERIYGVVFGESVKRIVSGKVEKDVLIDQGLTKTLEQIGIDEGGIRFINHPIIKEVLAARRRYMKEILLLGEVRDAFSLIHEVNQHNVLSVMARIAQSYEQLIIYQMFRVAKETNDFQIVLYQFDGVSIKFFRNKDKWLKILEEAVEFGCTELDIPSKLTYEKEEVVIAEEKSAIRFVHEMKPIFIKSEVRFGFPSEWKKDEGVVYVN